MQMTQMSTAFVCQKENLTGFSDAFRFSINIGNAFKENSIQAKRKRITGMLKLLKIK